MKLLFCGPEPQRPECLQGDFLEICHNTFLEICHNTSQLLPQHGTPLAIYILQLTLFSYYTKVPKRSKQGSRGLFMAHFLYSLDHHLYVRYHVWMREWSLKKIPHTGDKAFYTLYEQKFSIMRPPISIYFSQGL